MSTKWLLPKKRLKVSSFSHPFFFLIYKSCFVFLPNTIVFRDGTNLFLFYVDEAQYKLKLKKENFPILCQLFHFLHNKQFNKKLTKEKSKYIQAFFEILKKKGELMATEFGE